MGEVNNASLNTCTGCCTNFWHSLSLQVCLESTQHCVQMLHLQLEYHLWPCLVFFFASNSQYHWSKHVCNPNSSIPLPAKYYFACPEGKEPFLSWMEVVEGRATYYMFRLGRMCSERRQTSCVNLQRTNTKETSSCWGVTSRPILYSTCIVCLVSWLWVV